MSKGVPPFQPPTTPWGELYFICLFKGKGESSELANYSIKELFGFVFYVKILMKTKWSWEATWKYIIQSPRLTETRIQQVVRKTESIFLGHPGLVTFVTFMNVTNVTIKLPRTIFWRNIRPRNMEPINRAERNKDAKINCLLLLKHYISDFHSEDIYMLLPELLINKPMYAKCCLQSLNKRLS